MFLRMFVLEYLLHPVYIPILAAAGYIKLVDFATWRVAAITSRGYVAAVAVGKYTVLHVTATSTITRRNSTHTVTGRRPPPALRLRKQRRNPQGELLTCIPTRGIFFTIS